MEYAFRLAARRRAARSYQGRRVEICNRPSAYPRLATFPPRRRSPAVRPRTKTAIDATDFPSLYELEVHRTPPLSIRLLADWSRWPHERRSARRRLPGFLRTGETRRGAFAFRCQRLRQCPYPRASRAPRSDGHRLNIEC